MSCTKKFECLKSVYSTQQLLILLMNKCNSNMHLSLLWLANKNGNTNQYSCCNCTYLSLTTIGRLQLWNPAQLKRKWMTEYTNGLWLDHTWQQNSDRQALQQLTQNTQDLGNVFKLRYFSSCLPTENESERTKYAPSPTSSCKMTASSSQQPQSEHIWNLHLPLPHSKAFPLP